MPFRDDFEQLPPQQNVPQWSLVADTNPRAFSTAAAGLEMGVLAGGAQPGGAGNVQLQSRVDTPSGAYNIVQPLDPGNTYFVQYLRFNGSAAPTAYTVAQVIDQYSTVPVGQGALLRGVTDVHDTIKRAGLRGASQSLYAEINPANETLSIVQNGVTLHSQLLTTAQFLSIAAAYDGSSYPQIALWLEVFGGNARAWTESWYTYHGVNQTPPGSDPFFVTPKIPVAPFTETVTYSLGNTALAETFDRWGTGGSPLFQLLVPELANSVDASRENTIITNENVRLVYTIPSAGMWTLTCGDAYVFASGTQIYISLGDDTAMLTDMAFAGTRRAISIEGPPGARHAVLRDAVGAVVEQAPLSDAFAGNPLGVTLSYNPPDGDAVSRFVVHLLESVPAAPIPGFGLYERQQPREAPPRLAGDTPQAILATMGSVKDDTLLDSMDALAEAFASTASEARLEQIGLDRGLERYPTETLESYRNAVRNARAVHYWRGTPKGIIDEFARFGYAATYMPLRPDPKHWAEFVIVLRNGRITRAEGDGGPWDIGISTGERDALVRLARRWKNSDERLAMIVFALEDDSFWGDDDDWTDAPTDVWESTSRVIYARKWNWGDGDDTWTDDGDWGLTDTFPTKED